MNIVDTNLLIYAYDGDSPRHAQAAAWFEDLINSGAGIGFAEVFWSDLFA